jgi:hypothetical protein
VLATLSVRAAPALHASGARPAGTLGSGERSGVSGRRTARLRNGLVISQVAFIRLFRGRLFTDEDVAEGRRVTVINQTMADQFWPGADPIGQHVSSAYHRTVRPKSSESWGTSKSSDSMSRRLQKCIRPTNGGAS